MTHRLATTLAIMLLSAAVFLGGYWLGQSPYAPVALDAPGSGSAKALEPFWEVWRLLHRHYFDQPLDDEMLVRGAIDGMLATLGDANTRYLPPEAETSARETMKGEIEGIGAEVASQNGDIVVVSPFEGSPAAAAGIQPGDILREADATALTGLSVAEAAALVRGPAGTEVRLVIERNGEQFELTVTRDVIRVPSVRGEMLPEGIGYVRISRFGDRTAEELAQLLEELVSGEPAGLILDLRRNPGGGLATAVSVADQFLGEGLVLIERFGDGREEVYSASDQGLAQDLALVVLIDEGSASASEVLAGAIRDRDRGTLIGVSSFGKGTVQTWETLSNGGGVRITVARWLTPNGDWVDERGLEPDIVVPPGDEPAADRQVEAAINYLLGRPVEQGTP